MRGATAVLLVLAGAFLGRLSHKLYWCLRCDIYALSRRAGKNGNCVGAVSVCAVGALPIALRDGPSGNPNQTIPSMHALQRPPWLPSMGRRWVKGVGQ